MLGALLAETRALVARASRAVDAKDGATFCDLSTPDVRSAVVSYGARVGARGECGTVMIAQMPKFGTSVTDVQVNGSSASAIDSNGKPERFSKIDGRWLMATSPSD